MSKVLTSFGLSQSSLEIPLVHITGVRADSEVACGWWHGVRMPGTSVPGVITAGTFYQDGKRVFWDVHHPEKTIVIDLHDERFNELVVEVADPEAAAISTRWSASIPSEARKSSTRIASKCASDELRRNRGRKVAKNRSCERPFLKRSTTRQRAKFPINSSGCSERTSGNCERY